jgi:hypothetical protein
MLFNYHILKISHVKNDNFFLFDIQIPWENVFQKNVLLPVYKVSLDGAIIL